MIDSGRLMLTASPRADSPASRCELVMDLYAPMVLDEETGESKRDPSCGLISREQAAKLLRVKL